jgi:hypothetical protein
MMASESRVNDSEFGSKIDPHLSYCTVAVARGLSRW